ncbi:MAG: hypothetical protein HQL64_02275 [Magnetococcales bacterium]|nr:hypothetical protein [Magnetococcales bacterium]
MPDPSPPRSSLPESLLETLSSGDGVQASLDAVRQSMVDSMARQGLSPEAANKAGQQLVDSFLQTMGDGRPPQEAFTTAQRLVETTQAQEKTILQGAGADLTQGLATGQGVAEQLSRIMESGGVTSEAGRQAFASAMQTDLNRGQTAGTAIQTAQQQAKETQQSAQSITPNTQEAQLDQAISLGREATQQQITALTAGMSPEQAAIFLRALEESLARGMSMGDALREANKQAEVHTNTEAATKVPADKLATALASGQDADQALREAGIDPQSAGAAHLEQALQGGNSTGEAMAQASAATQAALAVTGAQNVPLSPANQLAMALAGGDVAAARAASQDGNIPAVMDALAAGKTPQESLRIAETMAQAIQQQTALVQTPLSPAMQLAAALATGDKAVIQNQIATSNEAFVQTLTQALAGGANLSQAYQAADLHAAATQAQTLSIIVPISTTGVQAALLAMANPDTAIRASDGLVQAGVTLSASSPGQVSIGTPLQPPPAVVTATPVTATPITQATTVQATTVATLPPAGREAPVPTVADVRSSPPAVADAPPVVASGRPADTVPPIVKAPGAEPPLIKPPVTIVPTIKAEAVTTTPVTQPLPPHINQAPLLTVPTAQSVNQDIVLAISGLAVADTDANGSSEQLTLSVTHGTLTLAQTTGLTLTSGSSGSATMALTGTLSALNSAISTLTYQGDQNYSGTDALTLIVNDLGHTGAGGALTDSKSVALTVNPVVTPPVSWNQPPIITVPTAQSVDEDTGLAITGLSVADVDAGGDPLELSLSVAHGVLTLAQVTGLTFINGGIPREGLGPTFLTGVGPGDSTIIFNGTLSDINNAISTLTYRGTLNYSGADTLNLSVTERYNHGGSFSLVDLKSMAITVNAVNDAPLLTVPTAKSVNENTSLSITGLSVTDADIGNNPLRMTLSVAHGNLTLAQTSGLTFTIGSPLTGGTALIVTGTLNNLNSALATLTYQGSQNYSGADTLNLVVSDLGNTGAGGALTDTKSVDITINTVNRAPVLTVPTAQSLNENTSAGITGFSVADVDAGSGVMQMSLSVGHGTLSLAATTGLTFLVGSGSGSSSMVFTGTSSAINTAIATLTYAGGTNYYGSDTLSLTINDRGNTGAGQAQTDTKSVALTVNPVLTPVQVNFAPIVNADVVVNGTDDPAMMATFADASGGEFVTQSVANSNIATPVGLVDSGTYAATNYHLVAQILATETNNGNNVVQDSAPNTTPVSVTSGIYEDIHVYATSTDGNGQFHVVFHYSDGTTSSSATATVSDWFTAITPTSNKYYLVGGMDRWDGMMADWQNTALTNVGNLYGANIYGHTFTIDNTRTLTSIDLVTDAVAPGGGNLMYFGATLESYSVINSAPIHTVPGAQLTRAQTNLSLSGFSVTDLDVGADTMQETLTVAHGTLSLAQTTGLTFTTGDGTSDTTMTFTGTLGAINSAIRTLTYLGDTGYVGTDTLTTTISDLGHSGSGGVLSDTKSVTIYNDASPTGGVSITGTATQGQTLTANTSTLADTDGLGTLSYQWLENGTAIAGATGNTLVLAGAQVGKVITVTASYTDLHGMAESATSSATGTVASVNQSPTGSVTITGTTTQGQTLTADTSAVADANGLGAFSHQWYADGTAIAGATGSTLVLAAAQVGKLITVTASYTDLAGTAESLTSSATSTIDDGSGRFIAGDGSGGGGGGGNQNTSASVGGAGGGNADTLTGTNLDDVIFGDGSGGGGGCQHFGTYNGGAAGGGIDTIYGGAGNDIIFGDGFKGGQGYFNNTVSGTGGAGGLGGGGGGGGSGGVNGAAVAQPGMNGGSGGIGGGGGGGGAPLVYTLAIGTGGSGGTGGGSAGSNGATGDNVTAGTGGTGGTALQGATAGSGALGGDSPGLANWSGGGGGGGAGLNAGGGGAGGQGGSYNSGNHSLAGSAGDTSVVALSDTGSTIHTYVSGQLATIFTSTPGTINGYGAGADTLDGGSGSDNLFGLGGNDIFVFELNDAGAADTDTVWDFDKNSEADKLKLTQSGSVISSATLTSLLTAQTASGNDRSIVFTDGAGKQVTILVKGIARNLVAGDFCSAGASDPLVLDLNGRGAQLTTMDKGVRFDVDGSGTSVQTGWIGEGNGLLVMDLSGNGKIDGMQEVMSGVMVPGARTSLDALASFDADHNGQIDTRDAVFTHLQVWTDRSHDGMSTPDELLTLSDLGINSFGLNLDQSGVKLVNGNHISGSVKVLYADGHAGNMSVVDFATDTSSVHATAVDNDTTANHAATWTTGHDATPLAWHALTSATGHDETPVTRLDAMTPSKAGALAAALIIGPAASCIDKEATDALSPHATGHDTETSSREATHATATPAIEHNAVPFPRETDEGGVVPMGAQAITPLHGEGTNHLPTPSSPAAPPTTQGGKNGVVSPVQEDAPIPSNINMTMGEIPHRPAISTESSTTQMVTNDAAAAHDSAKNQPWLAVKEAGPLFVSPNPGILSQASWHQAASNDALSSNTFRSMVMGSDTPPLTSSLISPLHDEFSPIHDPVGHVDHVSVLFEHHASLF